MKKINSMRFMPDWCGDCGNAVTGLIELCFDIYKLDNNASNWVEIGSYAGESSLIISSFDYVKKLDCVDPFLIPEIEDRFKARMHHFMNNKQQKKVFLHKETSENYAKRVEDKSLDVVYIDGNHSYTSVVEDLSLWYPKIKNNGFICGHDYSKRFDGVVKAVNEFTQEHSLSIHKIYIDSSFLIIKDVT